MGDPQKTRKHFERPRKPWERERISSEKELKQKYGLRNNNEIWRMKTVLRRKRQNARRLLALPLEQRLKREKELIESLFRLGILSKDSTLDDVLGLNIDSVMERRLQTLVMRQGLANTALQARQFITHGHIAVSGQKVTSPSYLVRKDEEKQIGYYKQKIELAPRIVKPSAERKQLSAKEELKKKFEEVKEAAERIEATELGKEGDVNEQ